MKTLVLLIGVFLFPGMTFAENEKHHHEETNNHEEHGDHEEDEKETSSNVGPDKAVMEANAEQGIKLSEKASKTLEILTAPVKGSVPFAVPDRAYVRSRDEVGVYRLRDGWFKLVDPSQLKSGDQIVVQGAPLLRVAELDAFSAGEAGHAH